MSESLVSYLVIKSEAMDVIAGNAQEERDSNRHLWSRLYGTRTMKTIEPIPNPKTDITKSKNIGRRRDIKVVSACSVALAVLT